MLLDRFPKDSVDVGSETGIEIDENYRSSPEYKKQFKDSINEQDYDFAIETLVTLWDFYGKEVHDSASAIVDESLTKLNIEH